MHKWGTDFFKGLRASIEKLDRGILLEGRIFLICFIGRRGAASAITVLRTL